MAEVKLPARVLIKPCCTSGIDGFVLEKHTGALHLVMWTSCICEKNSRRLESIFILALCLALLKVAQLCCVGVVGLDWEKPHGDFQKHQREPESQQKLGFSWKVGAAGAVSQDMRQLLPPMGSVLLSVQSRTSPSQLQGELVNGYRLPLGQSMEVIYAIAA